MRHLMTAAPHASRRGPHRVFTVTRCGPLSPAHATACTTPTGSQESCCRPARPHSPGSSAGASPPEVPPPEVPPPKAPPPEAPPPEARARAALAAPAARAAQAVLRLGVLRKSRVSISWYISAGKGTYRMLLSAWSCPADSTMKAAYPSQRPNVL